MDGTIFLVKHILCEDLTMKFSFKMPVMRNKKYIKHSAGDVNTVSILLR